LLSGKVLVVACPSILFGSHLENPNFGQVAMADQLDCALDLMRRLPPSQIEDNLAGLIDLVPDLTEQLLSAVDQPLKIAHDPIAKRDYLLCDYNRDGDSYRYFISSMYIMYCSFCSRSQHQ
jgi:hypothetical protein